MCNHVRETDSVPHVWCSELTVWSCRAPCTILGAMEEKCPVIIVDCSNKMSALAINQVLTEAPSSCNII